MKGIARTRLLKNSVVQYLVSTDVQVSIMLLFFECGLRERFHLLHITMVLAIAGMLDVGAVRLCGYVCGVLFLFRFLPSCSTTDAHHVRCTMFLSESPLCLLGCVASLPDCISN
ncbi:hypothetical protein BKA82DRAFT_4150192 [Pisolithus tinctorius]|nr:hypothetical protein BKA82DRAFT_4150192 [Pisolithus tinctorius]